MPESAVKVSIIIVTHNSLAVLETCLKHLLVAAERIPHEIIVVDNNSSDNTPSFVKNFCPQANLHLNRENKGFASACNTGAELAESALLLFLNPDVFLDQPAITELLNSYWHSDRVGVAVGRLRFPDGKFQPTCRQLPTISNILFSRRGVIGLFSEENSRYTRPDYDEITSVPAAAAALMMISKELFKKIGRFDERFFMYMEDTDLCKRLIMAGFKNYYVPFAGAVHDWGRGSQAGTVRRSLYHHLSLYKYFSKHRQDWLARFVLPLPLLVNFILVNLLAMIRKPFQ
ncbi:MAG: glycosyltransferase family 2 protein [candidate division Zixibacteria bacterium]|nr:glycosyltransferase family 2 protein [candidate division Zixibacteria bacterium]